MAAALDFVVMAPSVAHGATGLGPLQARIGLAPPPFARKLRFDLLEAFVRVLVARDMAVAVGRCVVAPVAAGRVIDRKSTRLNYSHQCAHRMPASARKKNIYSNKIYELTK